MRLFPTMRRICQILGFQPEVLLSRCLDFKLSSDARSQLWSNILKKDFTVINNHGDSKRHPHFGDILKKNGCHLCCGWVQDAGDFSPGVVVPFDHLALCRAQLGGKSGSWPWGNHDGIGCFFFREPVHKSEKPRRTIEKPQKNHRIDLKPTGRYDRYEVEGKTWLAWEATVAPSWSEGCHLAMFWQHSNFPRVLWPKTNQWRGSLHQSKLIQAVYFLLILAFDTQKKCLSSAKFVVAPQWLDWENSLKSGKLYKLKTPIMKVHLII